MFLNYLLHFDEMALVDFDNNNFQPGFLSENRDFHETSPIMASPGVSDNPT